MSTYEKLVIIIMIFDLVVQIIATIKNVRGMDTQELVAALADMNENDRMSVQAYLESKGAWTTEIANQDTKEFEEYHLDVRYFTDTDEIVDVSNDKEMQTEETYPLWERQKP